MARTFDPQKPGLLNDEPVYFRSLIGEGAEGEVYEVLVEREKVSKRMALKIPLEGREYDESFGEEAQLIANRDSRFVCVPTGPFPVTLPNGIVTRGILMPIYDRGDLDDWRKQQAKNSRSISPNETADILIQVAIGLQDSGLVHADIKPRNLLINDQGQIGIADWGIASEKGERFQEIPGTPRYMAPETIKAAPRTSKVDVFALGLIGYELNTRRQGRIFPNTDDQMVILDTIANQQRSFKTKDPLFTTILREATWNDPGKRSDLQDLICDLCAYPAARARLSPKDLEAAASRLLDRRSLNPSRSPDVDLAAIDGLLQNWEGNAAYGASLRKERDILANQCLTSTDPHRPRNRLDDLLDQYEQEHGERIFPPAQLRGEVLLINAERRSQLTPQIVQTQETQWNTAIKNGAFTKEQQEFIRQARAAIPHLNQSEAKEIGRTIANDWLTFGRALGQNENQSYVAIQGNEVMHYGMVVRNEQRAAKDGLWITVNESGRLVRTAHYQNGILHGTTQDFHPNGLIAKKTTYCLGEIHGEMEQWSSTGSLLGRDDFIQGAISRRNITKFDQNHQTRAGPSW
jgi:serine/threonine protein kinase